MNLSSLVLIGQGMFSVVKEKDKNKTKAKTKGGKKKEKERRKKSPSPQHSSHVVIITVRNEKES